MGIIAGTVVSVREHKATEFGEAELQIEVDLGSGASFNVFARNLRQIEPDPNLFPKSPLFEVGDACILDTSNDQRNDDYIDGAVVGAVGRYGRLVTVTYDTHDDDAS